MDVETFLCQSRKKISFSKINLLNLRKNLVGPWGSTQLGERSPKPVSRPKSDTRKVSRPSSPQNRPTCTCSTLPRASARTSPLAMLRQHGPLYGRHSRRGHQRPAGYAARDGTCPARVYQRHFFSQLSASSLVVRKFEAN